MGNSSCISRHQRLTSFSIVQLIGPGGGVSVQAVVAGAVVFGRGAVELALFGALAPV